MTKPTDRNRLNGAASPYLQQHADNPVHWQPWDETALEAAKEMDRPIFLSVGYASCHWCHVMAEESFEDPAIAEKLNQNFVPIKVDREERPDIDSIYMTVCGLVTRGGCGWPLSVWLTPDRHPFYVGTYFPPSEKHGRPGFGELLDRIADTWETQRDRLEERGESWVAAASEELESVPLPTESSTEMDLLRAAGDEFLAEADEVHGGFGSGQKFPHVDRLVVLAKLADQPDGSASEAVLDEALSAMATGGIRDFVGGGFHRYCVDRTWTVPHFEKMLYDNAEIPRGFLHGYAISGEESFATVARETFRFVDRELRHPDGGFYSTLDARSHPTGDRNTEETPVEGAYYTWTPKDVRSAIKGVTDGKNAFEPGFLIDLFRERFDITKSGNFEGETVLSHHRSIEELAEEFDHPPDKISRGLQEATRRVRKARSARPRPPRDEKILADWNGLLVGSLATGSIVLQESAYAEMATEALDYVRENHWNGTRLAHRYKDGKRMDGDYLSDYAFMARGALKLHGATGELEPLSFALDLGRTMKERFWDEDQETLYFTTEHAEGLPIRPTATKDQSTPSSTGVAVEVLAALDHFTPEADFGGMASSIVRSYRNQMEETPGRYATLVLATDLVEKGHLEVTIAADAVPATWQPLIADRFLPDMLLSRRPPDDQRLENWLAELGLQSVPPIWEGRSARGEPTAFVCRQACSPPIRDADSLKNWLMEFGTES